MVKNSEKTNLKLILLILLILSSNYSFSENLHFNISGLDNYRGKALRARIIEKNTNKIVNYYYQPLITKSGLNAKISGLENGRDYLIEFYIDQNMNNKYDSNGVDKAWQYEIDRFSSKRDEVFNTFSRCSNLNWNESTKKFQIHFEGLSKHKHKNIIVRIYHIPTVDGPIELGTSKSNYIESDSININIPHEAIFSEYLSLVMEYYIDTNKDEILDGNEELWQYDFRYESGKRIEIKEPEKKRKVKK